MLELLNAAKPYMGQFKGIRLSTRPDCIDDEIVSLLKSYNVTSIELGAQSMDDDVLRLNERGHNSADVRKACGIIKNYGISLGLQMMTGLYGSDFYKDIYTADEFIKLRPDTVRIYPTVIMKDTQLADLYNSQRFIPYTLEQSVDLCSKLILKFKNENIRIIRLGLHYSESLENNSLGNNYHPAFKELCENKIFFDKITKLIKNYSDKEVDFFEAYVNPHSVSKLAGQNKSNINILNSMGYKIKIKTDQSIDEYEIYIKQR
jgi:histone acetyltransferase (RNA polymerase elongator complex component)